MSLPLSPGGAAPGPAVLLYNLPAPRAQAVCRLCASLGLAARPVPPMEQGQTLGAVLGLLPRAPGPGRVEGELLVLFALPEPTLDALLAGLRQEGLAGLLKAVVTPTNLSWPAPKLFRVVQKEARG